MVKKRNGDYQSIEDPTYVRNQQRNKADKKHRSIHDERMQNRCASETIVMTITRYTDPKQHARRREEEGRGERQHNDKPPEAARPINHKRLQQKRTKNHTIRNVQKRTEGKKRNGVHNVYRERITSVQRRHSQKVTPKHVYQYTHFMANT